MAGGRAIPGPDDFVVPGMVTESNVGEMSPVNEGVFRGKEEEPEVKPGGVYRGPQPVPMPEPPQKRLGVADFQPIKEVGREEQVTLVFIVPDNRPAVMLPLTGPGVYQVIVRKTTEAER